MDGNIFLNFKTKSTKNRVVQELRNESLNKRKVKSMVTTNKGETNNDIGLISGKNKLIQLSEHWDNSKLDSIIEKFEQSYITDKEWGDIQLQFNSIHNGIINQIQYESGRLTPNDIKLFILLKLKYSNASMAEILNISYEGVRKAKQRLGKKVDLNSI